MPLGLGTALDVVDVREERIELHARHVRPPSGVGGERPQHAATVGAEVALRRLLGAAAVALERDVLDAPAQLVATRVHLQDVKAVVRVGAVVCALPLCAGAHLPIAEDVDRNAAALADQNLVLRAVLVVRVVRAADGTA